MKILVLNPGATSTKIAIFDDFTNVFELNIPHPGEEIRAFSSIPDQFEYRLSLVLSALKSSGIGLGELSCVIGRGGLLRHIPSGTYLINDRAVHDMLHPPYGEHASNLGILLAKKIGDDLGVPSYFCDPVSVDELTDVARVTGFLGMERQSFFHALNHKSVARKACGMLDTTYENANLIIVHMGGGVSVAAHQNGRVVDVYNVKDEGAFGMDRCGSLPVNAVIDLCYSGQYDKKQLKSMLGSRGGMTSYLGTGDLRQTERMIDDGNAEAALYFEALAYQLSKDIGSMFAVLCGKCDAIVFTGGMANSKRLIGRLSHYCASLAPFINLPGEAEMEALAAGAMRAFKDGLVQNY